MARAPPQKLFDPPSVDVHAISYQLFNDESTGDDAGFNQDINW